MKVNSSNASGIFPGSGRNCDDPATVAS